MDLGQIIIASGVAVIAFFLKRHIDQMDKKNETTSDKIDEIEKNYLHRFEDVKEKIHQSEMRIINKLYEVCGK